MRATMMSRQDRIINYLNELGDVKIRDLSELCKVSSLTIRRDLEQLEYQVSKKAPALVASFEYQIWKPSWVTT